MENTKRLNLATTEYWLIASALFLTAFGVGVWGFLKTDALQLENFFYAVYYTLQLIFIDPPSLFYETTNWQLLVASVILPLFPAVAIFKLIARVFGVQVSLWRLFFWKDHHVFLGAGKLTAGVIDAVMANNSSLKALIVDKDVEQMVCNHIRANHRKQIRMLEHDVNERKFLRALRLHKADTIYVFTGDDQRNLEVSQKIIELLKQQTNLKGKRLVVNVESTQLRDFMSESLPFQWLRKQGVEVTWLSAQKQAAQEMLVRYPPSNYVKQSLHVGLIGDGPLVKDVVGQLIKQTLLDYSVDEHKARLDITLFSPDEALYQEVLDCYPVLAANSSVDEYGGLAPLAHVTHKRMSSTGLTPSSLAGVSRPLDAVYVLEKTDLDCVNSAFKAAQALVTTLANESDKPRIIVGLLGDSFRSIEDLYQSLGSAHRQIFQDVSWFHRLRDSFDQSEDYPGETVDLLGRPNSDFYYKKYSGKADATDEELENEFIENWRQKAEAFRDSDRQAGYHALTKLRFLGFALERRSVLTHVYSHLTYFVDDTHAIINQMLVALEKQCSRADAEKSIFDSLSRLPKRLELMLETIMIANPEGLSSRLNETLELCFSKARENKQFSLDQKNRLEAKLRGTIDNFFLDERDRQKLAHEAKVSLTQHKHELAQIEHRRFVNERIIDGWLCDSFIKNDVLNNSNEEPKSRKVHKLNHTIVDNQTLIEMDQITRSKEADKDDDVVEGLERALDDQDLMKRFILYRLPEEKLVSVNIPEGAKQ